MSKPVPLEDHALAAIFPLMADSDLDALAADIGVNGLRDPVWLYEGKILDGRNRYRACLKADYDPRTQEYGGKDPLGFVVSKNLHRRHLTESQRAMVADRIATARQGERNDLEPSANLQKVTRAEAAEKVQVSERLVADAHIVREQGTAELAAAVDAGDISVSAAAEVAKLPKDEQTEVVKAGPAAVKAKAKQQRAAKPKKADDTPAAATDTDPDAAPPDPAGEFVGRVNKLCHSLDAAKKVVAELAAVPVYGGHVHGESVAYQIEAARKALWQSRPTEPCNCVKGGKPPAAGCKACFGAGVTTPSRVLKGGR